MKKNIALSFFLLIVGFSATAQDNDEEPEIEIEKKNHVYLSIELLKTIPWLMIDNAYIIEPEIAYRSKSVLFSLQVGMNDVKNTIYDRLQYRNEGTYVKVGIGVDFSYFNDRPDVNNMILGGNLIFSSFKETGTIEFSDPYFDSPVFVQEHESRGLELYFTYRRVFDNNVFMSITPRVASVMSGFDEKHFPVYYAPGFGIVNIFESTDSNFNATVGLAIKMGYRF